MAAVVDPIEADLEDRIGYGLDHRAQLVAGGQQLDVAIAQVGPQGRPQAPLRDQVVGQQGQHQTGQQHRAGHQRQRRQIHPPLRRSQVQAPGAVGHLQAAPDRLAQRAGGGGRNHLDAAGLGMQSPQPVVVTPLTHLVEPGPTEQVRQPDRHIGKTPELRLAVSIVQKHRQAADDAQASLRQLQGSCQGQSPRVAREKRLALLGRVAQLIKPDQALVAFARRDMLYHPLGRQRDHQQSIVAAQQLTGGHFEMVDHPFALVHQGGQGVVDRQHAIDAALEDLGAVLGQVGNGVSLRAQKAGLDPGHAGGSDTQRQHQYQRCDGPCRPGGPFHGWL